MIKTLYFRFSAASLAIFMALTGRALADPQPSRVIEVPNSPVAVSRCSYDPADFGMGRANIMNRSEHSLLLVKVRFQFFDAEGVIGQAMFQASPGDNMLASGDSSLFTDQLNKPFSDPSAVLRYTTCRIDSATFTRGRTWRYGQHYSEKLLPVAVHHPIETPGSDVAEATGPSTSVGSSSLSPLLVATIGKFWMTNIPNNLPTPGSFVHVRVTLNSPNVIVVSPAEFRISMTLPNGATKAYSPLSQPAPRVLHGGFLSYTGDPVELGPSVAPDEDFGAIGKMSLKPNVSVTTVLTYQIDQPEAADAVHISLVR